MTPIEVRVSTTPFVTTGSSAATSAEMSAPALTTDALCSGFDALLLFLAGGLLDIPVKLF
jgi:hypothetical protein